MSWRRLLPAAVLGPLLLWAAAQEPVPAYVLGVGVCALIGSGELYLLLARAGYRPLWPLGVPLAVGLALSTLGGASWGYPHLLAGITFGGLVWAAFRHPRRDALLDWALTLAPALYVGGLLAYYPLLRALPHGGYWVPVVLGCTWAADIAAYFVGRRWGQTKLAPTLSPGKSAEGALGGLAGAVALAAVVAVVAPPPALSPLVLLGLGALVAIAGLIGDLAESFIKRQLGAKDASGLLLGHGGLLDRMDSLLAAGMVAYLYLLAIGR
jgi:phosphatidate cytidylyltransferase